MTQTQTTWSWRNEPELMARLRSAQNSAAFEHQDILTFAGWAGSHDALLRHVESCEQRMKESR